MIVVANVFPKLQTVEVLVIPYLNSAVSEHALTVHMWKRAKYFTNLHESALIMLFIILTEVDSESVSHSVRWILNGVC